jgi:hypothetical protein
VRTSPVVGSNLYRHMTQREACSRILHPEGNLHGVLYAAECAAAPAATIGSALSISCCMALLVASIVQI